jgi:adenylosuccinate lyase
MTSSDVLDTCLNVQLARAADILIADIDALLAALKAPRLRAQGHVTIGRSHGIHAEPTTFGLKLARPMPSSALPRPPGRRAQGDRHLRHLRRRRHLRQHRPAVEAYVAEKLGLRSSRSRPR